MIKWTRTSRLSIRNYLSLPYGGKPGQSVSETRKEVHSGSSESPGTEDLLIGWGSGLRD